MTIKKELLYKIHHTSMKNKQIIVNIQNNSIGIIYISCSKFVCVVHLTGNFYFFLISDHSLEKVFNSLLLIVFLCFSY